MLFAENKILQKINENYDHLKRPVVVALDGGSGSGKSTIAKHLKTITNLSLIPLDDFYQREIPEVDLPYMPARERLKKIFEWSRVREDAIIPLRHGQIARWQPFDFTKGVNGLGTYEVSENYKEVPPNRVVLVEGAYSASPPLRDLIDIAILVSVPVEIRHLRLHNRERGNETFLSKWHRIWDEVESFYFDEFSPPSSFDFVIENEKLHDDS